MKDQFINVQLFGDPAGDPNPLANGSSDPKAQTPGAGGDAPNAAAELLEFKKKYVPVEKYEAERNRADGYLAAIMNNREDDIVEGKAQTMKSMRMPWQKKCLLRTTK